MHISRCMRASSSTVGEGALSQQVLGLNAKFRGVVLQLLGELKSGTKATQLSSLQHGLRRTRIVHPVNRPTRILSIDMGIRNLAFCVLELGQMPTQGKSKSKTGEDLKPSLDLHESMEKLPWALDHVEVVAWKRLSLLRALGDRPASTSDDDVMSTEDSADDADDDHVSRAGSTKDKSSKMRARTQIADSKPPSTEESLKPDYSPLRVARLAHRLVKEVFLPFDVTHVLIERQRHRSGGGSAIQEWTVRVNMLESMLHATFETFRQHGKPSDNKRRQAPAITGTPDHGAEPSVAGDGKLLPSVHSVSPKTVNALYLEPTSEMGYLYHLYPPVSDVAKESKSKSVKGEARGNEAALIKSGNKSKTTKEQKIHIANTWVRRYLHFSKDATRSRDRFLLACDMSSRSSRGVRSQSNELMNCYVASLAKNSESSDTARSKQEYSHQTKTSNVGVQTLAADDKKLDDLTDCLLQGVAWVQWELNRRALAETLLLTGTVPKLTGREDSSGGEVDLTDLEAWPRSSPLPEFVGTENDVGNQLRSATRNSDRFGAQEKARRIDEPRSHRRQSKKMSP